jgi:tetratricopeptide (TPR) repeat protein
MNLCRIHLSEEMGELALPLAQEAHAKATNKLKPEHPTTLDAWRLVGDCHRLMGDTKQAQTIYDRVLAKLRESQNEKHPSVIACNNSIAKNALAEKDYAKAAPILDDVLRLNIDRLGPNHLSSWRIQHNIAECYHGLDKRDDAEKLWLELWERSTELPKPLFRSETRLQQKFATGLINLYEASEKPEQQQEWQAKLDAVGP